MADELGCDAVDLAGFELSEWLWCLHCERTYRAGEFRLIDGLQMCPYSDCDGDTVLDAQSWAKNFASRYGAVPERKRVYSLYD